MQINEAEINGKIASVEENVSISLNVLNEIVSRHSAQLDSIMNNIYRDIVSIKEPPIADIEKYFLELTNALYYFSTNTEYLSLSDGIAKSMYKEAYNNAYLSVNDNTDKSSKKTVAEVTAIAEAQTLYDQTVSDIYNKAYKILKAKVETAQTMVSTLSKVLSKRMSEQQLTATLPRVYEEQENGFT